MSFKRGFVIQLKCKKHPRYKAQLPPRASCEGCMDIYSIATNQRNTYNYLLVRPKVKVTREFKIDALEPNLDV